ncbi:ZINC FINGER protein [Salvia divinorum]|uniref:ZINC FINGER protein n=1 Tax=Salvia divinorum TaxID=28513 RepID=A0ABD1HSH5_SALDI
MLKFETDGGDATSSCDACRSAPSAVYCRVDQAYLCAICDARIHHAASLQDRVWLCECCEKAPAAFLCKADSASLCTSCDAKIHSANPLACRHHRVPVQPIPYGGLMTGPLSQEGEDEDEAASWLLMNGGGDETLPPLFAGELDGCLDFDLDDYGEGYSYNNVHSSYGGSNESIVPESTSEATVSHCHTRPSKGTIELFTSQGSSEMNREARVMRYREKKKRRKFEKTIRYASRKAYAETRPRIKGRFAKRKPAQGHVDHMFSSQPLKAYVVVSYF